MNSSLLQASLCIWCWKRNLISFKSAQILMLRFQFLSPVTDDFIYLIQLLLRYLCIFLPFKLSVWLNHSTALSELMYKTFIFFFFLQTLDTREHFFVKRTFCKLKAWKATHRYNSPLSHLTVQSQAFGAGDSKAWTGSVCPFSFFLLVNLVNSRFNSISKNTRGSVMSYLFCPWSSWSPL